jgi:hypothetical protein
MNYTIKNIKQDVLPNFIELEIIKNINTKPPECYNTISDDEINLLRSKFITNTKYSKYNITIEQINSIRSNYIKNKMIEHHYKLESKIKSMIKDYNNDVSVLELSKKYDGSPLNILRIIFKKTYSKTKAKIFFKKPKLLKSYDLGQFESAKKHDAFALINQDAILEKANIFEHDISKILDKLNIKYRTQEELTLEQIKTHGNPFNTPDFLIQSDFTINNIPIKWIDAKNYYGSDIKFIKKNLIAQMEKYIDKYGPGCVIYKLGFNELYNMKNILFLSYNIFKQLAKTDI